MFIRTKHYLGIRLRSATIIPGIRHLPLSAIAKPALFGRNRPFPRHGRGSPSQPPLLMACARAARISSACVQHQTEGPMRAHRQQMQGRRQSRGVRSRGTRGRRTFRERQNVSCCAPSARRTSPLCTRNPLFRREAPPCTPITFEAAELATITCQQARLASGKRPRLTPPAPSLR